MFSESKLKLVHYTPLDICKTAIRECYDSHDKSDDMGIKDMSLINTVGNIKKHFSVYDHVIYTFMHKGIPSLAKLEMLQSNSYVVMNRMMLVLNLRSFLDMLKDGKPLAARNMFLKELYAKMPDNHRYLIEDAYNSFNGGPNGH